METVIYKSKGDFISLGEIIQDVLGREANTEYYDSLVDDMQEVIFKLFPVWWKVQVREQARQIKKSLVNNGACKCEMCGNFSRNLEIHHRQDVSVFGGNELSNLSLLCSSCHRKLFVEDIGNE